MSQYPRTVLAPVTVNRDGGQTFVKSGSVVDIVPGSELEQAYGGSGKSLGGDTDRRPVAQPGGGTRAEQGSPSELALLATGL